MKNNKPIISIIVPVYQVEDYIENTMRSICKQSFKEFEVILVDDCTKDNSVNLAINILKSKNIEYQLVVHKKNKGLAAARNTGIKYAKGEWIVFVDSDDIICFRFLEILYNCCVKSNSLVSIGNYQEVTRDDIFKEPQYYNEYYKIIYRNECINYFLNRKIRILACTIFLNKQFLVMNNLFYNENIKFSEDQELIWRLLFNVDKIAYNETPLYNYLTRDGSIMTAPSEEKILTGFDGIMNLDVCNKKIKKTIVARWVLGAMHAYARNGNIQVFSSLIKKLDYKKHMKELILSKNIDLKTKIVSIVIRINTMFGYYCLTKI